MKSYHCFPVEYLTKLTHLIYHITFQPEVESLFTVLALCHTVRVERCNGLALGVYSTTGSDYNYHSPSPDEKALVEACARSENGCLIIYSVFYLSVLQGTLVCIWEDIWLHWPPELFVFFSL